MRSMFWSLQLQWSSAQSTCLSTRKQDSVGAMQLVWHSACPVVPPCENISQTAYDNQNNLMLNCLPTRNECANNARVETLLSQRAVVMVTGIGVAVVLHTCELVKRRPG